MESLEINKKSIANLEQLSIIESEIDRLVTKASAIKRKNFDSIIEYHKKNLNTNLSDDEKEKELQGLKDTISNKTILSDTLKEIKTESIFEVELDSNYLFNVEKKMHLKDIYYEFNVYCKDLIQNSKNIAYIKIYDFYQNKKDFEAIVNNIYKKKYELNNIKRLLAFFRSKNALNPSKIKILTGINSKLSFDFYGKIYSYESKNFPDNKINIKYIPESTSRNIYIPSLFYLIIKYADNNKNYKYLIAYLESSTNWAVVTTARPNNRNFSTQFFNLLNMRFDEQYDNASIYFQPNKTNKNLFNEDIDEIFIQLEKFSSDDENKNIDKNILKNIHKLKTKYKKINHAYKLLKSYYYFYSYLITIKNITKNTKLLNTNYIIGRILKNNFSEKIEELLLEIDLTNLKFNNIDVYKLRLAMIEKIDNKKAICDIFPTMNWSNEKNIIKNLIKIKSSQNYLDIFFRELNMSTNLSFEAKETQFRIKLLEKIRKGEKISFV